MTNPVQVWHPSCKIRLQLLIEDFSDTPPTPSNIDPSAQRAEIEQEGGVVGDKRYDAILNEDNIEFDAILDEDNQVLAAVGDLGIEAFGPGQEHDKSTIYRSIGFDIIPYTASIERNSYRLADECRVTFPGVRLPIDPALIRAATVQVFCGVIDPDLWAETYSSPGGPISMVPDFSSTGQSNEIFRGFIDDWDLEMAKGGARASFTARDLTQFFIDAEIPSNAMNNIPKTTTLDDAIRLLVYGDGLPPKTTKRPGLPGARGIAVTNATGADLPRLSSIKPPSWFGAKKTVKKGRKRGSRNDQKMTYWDIMTDLCVSAGFICYVRAGIDKAVGISGELQNISAEIVISNPRTYYAKSLGYGDEIVVPETVRRFIYGINIDSLKIRRSYTGKSQPKTVEVRAFDEAVGKEFVSRFPVKKKNNRPAVSGIGDREEIQVFVVRSQGGEKIQETLDAMSRSIYEQLNRGEIEVKVKTRSFGFLPRNMAPQEVPDTPQGAPILDPDVFRMTAGDPIFVGIDRADIDSADGRLSSFTAFAAASRDARIDQMVRSGFREDVAIEIANAYESQHVQREFRTQRVAISFSHTAGYDFEIDAINYLDVRNALRTGEEAKPAFPVVTGDPLKDTLAEGAVDDSVKIRFDDSQPQIEGGEDIDEVIENRKLIT